MLLEHNVDIEAKTEYGLTPLQLATFEQKPEMVEFLAAKCAKSSVTPSWSPSPTVSPCPSSTSPLSSFSLYVQTLALRLSLRTEKVAQLEE